MFKQQSTSHSPIHTSWVRRHRSKLIALSFWFTVVVGYWYTANYYNLPPEVMMKQLGDLLSNTFLGPLLFILFFTLQPLIFFPSALMAILAGCLYGPVEGFIVAIIGANGAGLTSYTVGRFFGQGLLDENKKENDLMHRYATYLRTNSFEAILIMHLLFLPYDLVNALAGFLRINWKTFFLATALGALPGTFTLVLFGSSIKGDLVNGAPEFNLFTLMLSGIILICSLALSQWLKHRQTYMRSTVANTI